MIKKYKETYQNMIMISFILEIIIYIIIPRITTSILLTLFITITFPIIILISNKEFKIHQYLIGMFISLILIRYIGVIIVFFGIIIFLVILNRNDLKLVYEEFKEEAISFITNTPVRVYLNLLKWTYSNTGIKVISFQIYKQYKKVDKDNVKMPFGVCFDFSLEGEFPQHINDLIEKENIDFEEFYVNPTFYTTKKTSNLYKVNNLCK
jgi:hypothetical protein